MRLCRYGKSGFEKPAMVDAEGRLRDLSKLFENIGPNELSPRGLKMLAKVKPGSLPVIANNPRWNIISIQTVKGKNMRGVKNLKQLDPCHLSHRLQPMADFVRLPPQGGGTVHRSTVNQLLTSPCRAHKKKGLKILLSNPLISFRFIVPRDRIELPTRGFSVEYFENPNSRYF